MDPYGTHLPVLRTLPHGLSVVEFGCGHHSTPHFIETQASVISIEMQDPHWFFAVKQDYGHHSNWKGFAAIGPWRFLEIPLPDRIDIGFVDGHKASRWGCVNYLMRLRVPIIVAHDTQAPGYAWGGINPEGYVRKDHTELTPWTTVWRREL